VTLTDADANHIGQAQVNLDMTFEVFNMQDEIAQRKVKSQLWEITIHRVCRLSEAGEVNTTEITYSNFKLL
jgi:hypothetical protein